jgi:hypothetical protein
VLLVVVRGVVVVILVVVAVLMGVDEVVVLVEVDEEFPSREIYSVVASLPGHKNPSSWLSQNCISGLKYELVGHLYNRDLPVKQLKK